MFFYNLYKHACQHGPSDSVFDFSVPSNPAGAQNIFCLGLRGRNICPKTIIWAEYFQPSVVSIYLINKQINEKNLISISKQLKLVNIKIFNDKPIAIKLKQIKINTI